MSTNTDGFDSGLFDRLFDFIYPDEECMSPEEVRAELRRLHIDIRPVMSQLEIKLNSLRQRQEAQQKLKSAKQQRPAVLERLEKIKFTTFPDARNELKKLINTLFGNAGAGAYARKLEDAASDDDLKSLIEDIQRLEAFSREESDGSS